MIINKLGPSCARLRINWASLLRLRYHWELKVIPVCSGIFFLLISCSLRHLLFMLSAMEVFFHLFKVSTFVLRFTGEDLQCYKANSYFPCYVNHFKFKVVLNTARLPNFPNCFELFFTRPTYVTKESIASWFPAIQVIFHWGRLPCK